jgi:hypothetical protein
VSIFDLFSKRQKRLRGEMPDVYTYDSVPGPLKVQIIHVVQDALGDDSWSGAGSQSKQLYTSIHDILAREYGKFTLASSNEPQERLFQFFLETTNAEQALDCIELFCGSIARYGADYSYTYQTRPRVQPTEAIAEINARFKEHGIGYQFESGELVRVDSQFLHAEAVKPALKLLSRKEYHTASEEFLRAHDHFRHGRHEEAIADSLKSLESVLKVIAAQRNWGAKETDTAKPLLDLAFKNRLIPDYLQSEFSGLRSALESGVPTVRNRQAGHGQGTAPRNVPGFLSSYILHLTASSILFLVSADDANP